MYPRDEKHLDSDMSCSETEAADMLKRASLVQKMSAQQEVMLQKDAPEVNYIRQDVSFDRHGPIVK